MCSTLVQHKARLHPPTLISDKGLICGTALVAITSASAPSTAFSSSAEPDVTMSPTKISLSLAPQSLSCLALCTQATQ